jgi:hypothetical protein
VTELEEIASSPLEDETSATGSGPAPLELSSQAVNIAKDSKIKIAYAIVFLLFRKILFIAKELLI